ncbi:MAG: mandelate racemase/muconate lactonizing enzyme family protein [Chloroflexi bacterium]|nr:mandelate racemase/muconate lactonizing enzyme family protein [Chloroflexota bacterium]
MKIIKIETLQWRFLPRLLTVRVHTDTGIVGLGETVDKAAATKGALHGIIAPLVLGQNPLDIERIWRFAFDSIMFHGWSGAELRALSAVEIALWDILGKVYEAPIYRLLGGPVRQHVPTYNTCAGFGEIDDYAMWSQEDGARAGDLAEDLLAGGTSAIKIWPFDRFSEATHGQYISLSDVEKGLEPIRRIRERVGDAMEIGIECHFRWNRASMERIAAALEPYNILFIEDPMPATNADEIKRLSESTSIPIVGSELLMSRWGLRDWLVKQVSQIVMTDPTWSGGISETRKVASMAEAFGVPIVFHNVAGPVCHAVGIHLGAHVPNLMFLESCRAFYKSYYGEISSCRPQLTPDGFDLLEGPGLGVELLPGALERSDLVIQTSDGEGLAAGKASMGDHWENIDLL